MERDAFPIAYEPEGQKLPCGGQDGTGVFNEDYANDDVCFPKGLEMPVVSDLCSNLTSCELEDATIGDIPTGGFTEAMDNTPVLNNLSKIFNFW